VDRKQCRYTDENGQTVNPMLADCPQAVSAVKAIAIAASQGQKIYTITQKNAAVALPQLSVSRTVAAEIRNALAAGKEVTVHEKAISAYGFSGVGYIIVDPDTGAGAYLIEGGGNGAFLMGLLFGIAFLSTLILYVISFPVSEAFVMAFLPVIAPLIGAVMGNIINYFNSLSYESKNCFITGFLTGITALLIPLGLSPIASAPLVSQIMAYFGIAGIVPFIAADLPGQYACLFK
jgi:hypothetical protein